jgi:hypothetical protein
VQGQEWRDKQWADVAWKAAERAPSKRAVLTILELLLLSIGSRLWMMFLVLGTKQCEASGLYT